MRLPFRAVAVWLGLGAATVVAGWLLPRTIADVASPDTQDRCRALGAAAASHAGCREMWRAARERFLEGAP